MYYDIYEANQLIIKRMIIMTVRQRILTLKLNEKIKNDPEYANKIGIKNATEKDTIKKSKKNKPY
jgi:hypothetical protein